jgi:hypothetical protein
MEHLRELWRLDIQEQFLEESTTLAGGVRDGTIEKCEGGIPDL